MKRSVAMMACVLSGAMVLGSFSPVMAETGAKAVSATVTDSKSSDDKKDDAKADTADKKDDAKDTVLEDGTYSAEFDTDSSMFHVNEANDGKGTLTVKDGKMTIHVSLNSKKIVNLFVGKADDAQKDGAEILEPTTDEVTYSDGYTEEVYGFDIPVPAIDEEFDVALIGKKNKWYDHKVKVTNPQKEADAEASDTKETDAKKVTAEDLKLEDGDYTAEVKMEGGSGKASVTSPTGFTVKDGKVTASVEWSSPYYDYMLIGDEKYEPVNKDGNSVFEIPVDGFDYPMEVVADTVAIDTVGGVDDLSGQTSRHGLLATGAAVSGEPTQTQGLTASRADLQGDLVVSTAAAAGLALEVRHDVLHSLFEHLERVVAGLFLPRNSRQTPARSTPMSRQIFCSSSCSRSSCTTSRTFMRASWKSWGF